MLKNIKLPKTYFKSCFVKTLGFLNIQLFLLEFIGHRRWNPEGLPGFPTQKPPHRPPILRPVLPLPNQPTRVPPLLPIKLPNQSPPMLPPTLKPTCNCCCHPCPCDSTPSIDSLKLIKSHKL